MRPSLLVVIDTEEEFDWSAPFSRQARSTANLREQHRAQAIFDRHGVAPLYVVDHPVASDPWAMRWLRETRDRGGCEIGAHLHPWVTPPFEEQVSRANSYACNLPPALQYAKIVTLTNRIAEATGEQPRAFRTGRYGVGAATWQALVACGYSTDLSIAPHSSFVDQNGPSFYGWHNRPFWADPEHRLLSLPVTTGFSGILRGLGPRAAPLLDRDSMRRAHVPGLLSWMRMIERARVTPEGTGLAELKRVLGALVRDGEPVVTLSYHSSTLLPGATAYARDEGECDAFLDRLDAALTHWTDALGGVFASCSAIDATIRGARLPDRLPNLKPDAIASCQTST
jgi:hypothetical protein